MKHRAIGAFSCAVALTLAAAGCGPQGGSGDGGGGGGDSAVSAGCRSDRECSARGLVCDRSTGQCVQCASAGDCAAGQQCTRGACAAVISCTSSRMCPNQVCNTTRGVCVDCVADVDCPTTDTCQDSRCAPRPLPCASDRECSATGKVCDTGLGLCVECVRNTDCTDGAFCSAEQRCQRQVCMPGTRSCIDDARRRECNAGGTAFVETACGAGERCASGACVANPTMDGAVTMDATPPDVFTPPDEFTPPPDVFVPRDEFTPPPDVFVPPDAPTAGSCPAPGDMRIPSGRPYQTFVLRASDFLGAATAPMWSIEAGNPCDQLTIASTGRGTFTVNGAFTTASSGDSVQFRPHLSGTYRVTVTGTVGGATQRCSFDVRVSAPGFRVEMFRTPNVDLDLWLHDPRNTNPWVAAGGTTASNDVCSFSNCRNNSGTASVNWGYTPTAMGSCNEVNAAGCNNPRLELDVISEASQAEVIAVDAPRVGETFRFGVNYYSAGGSTSASQAYPMVLVHCGGMLRATLGGATVGTRTIGSTPLTGFVPGAGSTNGTLWRAADVTMTAADNCTVQTLVPSVGTGTYCVDTSTDRSFNGACRRGP